MGDYAAVRILEGDPDDSDELIEEIIPASVNLMVPRDGILKYRSGFLNKEEEGEDLILYDYTGDLRMPMGLGLEIIHRSLGVEGSLASPAYITTKEDISLLMPQRVGLRISAVSRAGQVYYNGSPMGNRYQFGFNTENTFENLLDLYKEEMMAETPSPGVTEDEEGLKASFLPMPEPDPFDICLEERIIRLESWKDIRIHLFNSNMKKYTEYDPETLESLDEEEFREATQQSAEKLIREIGGDGV